MLNQLKKILSILLVIVMALFISTTALASDNEKAEVISGESMKFDSVDDETGLANNGLPIKKIR